MLFYAVEGNASGRFDHATMRSVAVRAWCPPSQHLDIPRVHPTWGVQNNGTWAAADLGKIRAKITELLPTKLPDTAAQTWIVLDAEWSKPVTTADIRACSQVVDFIKQQRPRAIVAMYNFTQGGDIFDGTTAPLYIGKPVLVDGSYSDHWTPKYFREEMALRMLALRPDKPKLALVMRRYEQAHTDKEIDDYELTTVLALAKEHKAQVMSWNPVQTPEEIAPVVPFNQRIARRLWTMYRGS